MFVFIHRGNYDTFEKVRNNLDSYNPNNFIKSISFKPLLNS